MELETLNNYQEYMKFLSKIIRGRDIYFSTNGNGSTVFESENASYLEKMGMQNHPDKDHTDRAYLGILSDGEAVYEMQSDRMAEYFYKISDHSTIRLKSIGGIPIDEGTPISSISVNNTEYSMNYNGLNLVIYDRETDCVIDSVAISSGEEGMLNISHRNNPDLIQAYKRAKYNIDRGLGL